MIFIQSQVGVGVISHRHGCFKLLRHNCLSRVLEGLLSDGECV